MEIYLPIAEMPVNVFLIVGLGAAVGFLSGKFGVGGGFILTPFLMFWGIPPAVAVATQSSQIVASSVSGVMTHWRKGNVDFKMGYVLLVGGLAGNEHSLPTVPLYDDVVQLIARSGIAYTPTVIVAFGGALSIYRLLAVVAAVAPDVAVIITGEFEGGFHLHVAKRPRAVGIVEIMNTVLKKRTDRLFLGLPDQIGRAHV